MKRTSSKDATIEHEPTDYELILASILFLMTHYARRPDTPVARTIEEHLHRLARHADQDSDYMIKTCTRLQKQWQEVRTSNAGMNVLKPADFWPLSSNTIN